MRRYTRVTAVILLLLILTLGAWVEAVPLWQLGILDEQVARSTESALSEPLMLVVLATAMAFSARRLRRQPSTD